MKNIFSGTLFLLGLAVASTLHAQVAPSIEWEKCLGGYGEESSYCVQQTPDGGFIIAAGACSNDGDVSGNHGSINYSDGWIIKSDTVGNIVWQKCLGGSNEDFTTSIQQTSDGGFIVAGLSNSTDGDVTGNHGLDDYWIVKLDSVGDLIWEKSLGGTMEDQAWSVEQTTDGGFIIAGFSASENGDVTGHHGLSSQYDCWIVKLDTIGNLLWEKSLGGTESDEAYTIHQTTDGGFIVAGYTYSNDDDVSGNHGGWDYWIVKLDTVGNIAWQKCLGGSNNDGNNDTGEPISIQQTTDGGFIVAGQAQSNDGDVSGNHGSTDAWVAKLDSIGDILWQKSLGGSHADGAYSIQQTSDEGFIVAGWTFSNDGDVLGNHSTEKDEWIVKLDTAGNLVWQKCLGGANYDDAYSVQQTTDSGFIITGSSASVDGDVTGLHGYWGDCWVVKLTYDLPTGVASVSNNFISLYPNPVQTQLTLVLHSFSEGGINLAIPANEVNVHVYDLQGKMIALPTTFTNTQAQLNTASLADGFYTLQITNNKTGENEVSKFVKQ